MLALCFACTSDSLVKDNSKLHEPFTANMIDANVATDGQCYFKGKTYNTGDIFCAPDGCSACICNADGAKGVQCAKTDCDTNSAASACQTTVARHEVRLYTEGTRIMRNGKEFKVLGMDVDHHPLLKRSDKSNADSPYETLFTPEDMDFFKKNGFNLVPLHNILMDEMTDGKGNINEDFFKNWIDVWVEWATQRKLYISIGMSSFYVPDMTWGVYPMPHWVADDYGGRPEGKNWREQMRTIIHGFYGMDERSQSKREVYYQLWKYIASRYKNNPYVLYAPTNEPLHHTFQDFKPDESILA